MEWTLPDLFDLDIGETEQHKKVKEELEQAKLDLHNLKMEHEEKLCDLLEQLRRLKEEKVERVSTLKKEHIQELEKVKAFYEAQRNIDEKMTIIMNQELEVKEEQNDEMLRKLGDKMKELRDEKIELEKKMMEQQKELEIRKTIEKNNEKIKNIKASKLSSSFERLYRGESSVGGVVKKPLLKRTLTKSNV